MRRAPSGEPGVQSREDQDSLAAVLAAEVAGYTERGQPDSTQCGAARFGVKSALKGSANGARGETANAGA